jgi:hypothetical protein
MDGQGNDIGAGNSGNFQDGADKTAALSRRKVLKAFGAGAGGVGISGCRWLLPSRPTDLSPSNDHMSPAIDAHCHVFNGRDVPVFEFARQAFLDSDEDRIKEMLEPLLNLLILFIETAPTADQERDALEGRGKFTQVSLEEVLRTSFDTIVRETSTLRPLYLGDNPDIDAHRKLVRLLGRELDDEGRGAAENIAASIGEPTLLRDDSLSIFSRQIAKRLQPDGRPFSIPPTLGDLFRYIAWINLFRRLRSEITSELITLYGAGDSDAGRVQLFTTSFLDLENWLDERWLYPNGKPPYPRLDVEQFHKQIELMELIANRNKGRLMPIAPFDPWRQALYRRKPTGQEPLEIVKNAVRNMGFVAVKIYPPMGFRPLGNARLAADPTEEATCPAGGHVMDDELPHKNVNDSHAEHMEHVRVAAYRVLRDGNRFTFPPKAVVDFPEEDKNEFIFLRFGRALDDALHELYSWCSNEGVSIMTHCLNTQGPKHCYAGRSHPKYWEEVLELYPGLRVNLGHFGNMFALSESAPPKGNWAETVVEIAATYGGAYTDVGYFQHILYRDETDPLQCSCPG